MSYIRPDKAVKVPIEDGELLLSTAYDTIHHFPPIGGYILKYWNQDGGGMSNVMMSDASAKFLAVTCDLVIVERPFILNSENQALMTWQADHLTEEGFGL